MSYIKTQWQNGQEPPINAENLNKIEQGIYEAHQKAEEKYTKPSLGIPKNDLAESVKDSLNNADSALQDDDVDSTLSPISTNPVQNKIITNKIAGTDRRLDALYELTHGQAWDFETVENDTNPVIVPNGAKMCNLQKISGRSVVWNQLVQNGNFADNSKWASSTGTFTIANNKGTFIASESSLGFRNVVNELDNPLITGHKYFVSGKIKVVSITNANCSISLVLNNGAYQAAVTQRNVVAGTTYDMSSIQTLTVGGSLKSLFAYLPHSNATAGDKFEISDVYVADLTQHFGAGNEPTTTSDPRIEWIKQYANEHPEYKACEIISFGCSEVETVGKNLVANGDDLLRATGWRKDGNKYIGAIGNLHLVSNNIESSFWRGIYKPNTQYTISLHYEFETSEIIIVGFWYSDGTRNQTLTSGISGDISFTSDVGKTCVGVRFSYVDSVNVALSNIQIEEGSTATPYSPYHAETIELPIATYFPDGIKSAVNARDEMTKDKAVKRIGKVDLGSLNYSASSNNRFFNASFLVKPSPDNNTKANAIIVGYESQTGNGYINYDKSCYVGTNGIVYIRDVNYTDPTAFKTAMQGKYLYYELATPIETTVTDWIEPFTVEAGGTITFVDGEENSIPTNTAEEYTVKLSEVVSNG